MSFRRPTFRRGYRRKFRKFKKSFGYRKISRVAKAVVRKQKIKKCNDVYMNGVSLTTTTGTIGYITNVQRGSGNLGSHGEEASRVSNRIQNMTLSWKIKCVGSQTNVIALADVYNTVRFILFRVHAPNASTTYATVSSVQTALLQGATAASTDDMFQPRHEEFTVLRDQTIVLRQVATGGTGTNGAVAPGVGWLKGSIKGKVLGKTTFSSDGSGTDTRGAIGFIIFSDSAATPNPTASGTVRLWYTDA